MNELLTALVAASKAGFEAPQCGTCHGAKQHVPRCRLCGYGAEDCSCHNPPVTCPACHATGLDASDPERLIGRAESWLLARGLDIKVTWRTLDVFTLADPDGYHEQHDSTPAGLAIALLRLVARVGGAT